jgi:hypothetical protein
MCAERGRAGGDSAFLWRPTEKWRRCTQNFQRSRALMESKHHFRAGSGCWRPENVEIFACSDRKNTVAATKNGAWVGSEGKFEVARIRPSKTGMRRGGRRNRGIENRNGIKKVGEFLYMKFPHLFLRAGAVESFSKRRNYDFRPDRTPKPLKFMWGNFEIQNSPTFFAHS